MNHLLVCREYPPAPYPAGGIGTYAKHISRLLALAGETVHVIGQRWSGAPAATEELCNGRLIIHRVPLEPGSGDAQPGDSEARTLFATQFPPQAFGYRAGLLVEQLVEDAGIDLIEAQEWEAPLYYFQLRRAMGLGPSRQPPCVVHLHSPTEFIVRHNDWDPGRPDYVMAMRLESHSILAADGLLCPSRFLASQAESHYGLPSGAVRTIPLPLGDTLPLERSDGVWQDGPLMYVGRLEPRKGVLEWAAAAARVASRRSDARFAFVGADLPHSESRSVLSSARRLIPTGLESRFTFYGELPRSELPWLLAQARIAVVPSRWENFPNTCVEAMGSGVPVLATRQGGMAEMIEDGETGWLADRADPDLLAAALERALDTPADRLRAMGERARARIARLCDSDTVTRAHLEYRRELAGIRPGRSNRIPVLGFPPRAAPPEPVSGIAVIVRQREHPTEHEECLRLLAEQSQAPVLVLVVSEQSREGQSPYTAAREVTRRLGVDPLGFLFLTDTSRPTRNLIEACARILDRRAEVGLMTDWSSHPEPWLIGPCPSFPYQLLSNEAGTMVLFRAAALEQASEPEADLPMSYGLWALTNQLLSQGWAAVAYPGMLLEPSRHRPERIAEHWGAWPRVLRLTPAVVERHATALLLLLESERARLQRHLVVVPREHAQSAKVFFQLPPVQQLAVVRRALQRPGRAAWRVIWLTKHAIYRQTRRWFNWPHRGRP